MASSSGARPSVAEFFAGRSVLITGATGFVGKVREDDEDAAEKGAVEEGLDCGTNTGRALAHEHGRARTRTGEGLGRRGHGLRGREAG